MWDPPSALISGYQGSSPRSKWPERETVHSSPSSAEMTICTARPPFLTVVTARAATASPCYTPMSRVFDVYFCPICRLINKASTGQLYSTTMWHQLAYWLRKGIVWSGSVTVNGIEYCPGCAVHPTTCLRTTATTQTLTLHPSGTRHCAVALLGIKVSEGNVASVLSADKSGGSRAAVTVYHNTRRHITEDDNFRIAEKTSNLTKFHC